MDNLLYTPVRAYNGNKNASSRKVRESELETLLKWCDHSGLVSSGLVDQQKVDPFDWSGCHI